MEDLTKKFEQIRTDDDHDSILDEVLDKFEQGLNIEGLITFINICFENGNISDCLRLITQVEQDFEVVTVLEWSTHFFLSDLSSRDKWTFYCNILIGLVQSSDPRESVTKFILQKMLAWIETDSTLSQGSTTISQIFRASLSLYCLQYLAAHLSEKFPEYATRFRDSLRSKILNEELAKEVRSVYLDAFCHLIAVPVGAIGPEPYHFEAKNEETTSIDSLTNSTRILGNTLLTETLSSDNLTKTRDSRSTSEAELRAIFSSLPDSLVSNNCPNVVGKLVILSSGKWHNLVFGSSLNIGRSSNHCRVVLKQPNISRAHAQVFVTQAGVYIQILSDHTIAINGKFKRVVAQSKFRMSDEDVISFGTEKIKFELNSHNFLRNTDSDTNNNCTITDSKSNTSKNEEQKIQSFKEQVHLPDKIYDFQFQPDLDDTDLETDELEPPQNISDEKKFLDSVILRSSPVRLTDQLANPDNIYFLRTKPFRRLFNLRFLKVETSKNSILYIIQSQSSVNREKSKKYANNCDPYDTDVDVIVELEESSTSIGYLFPE